MSSGNFIVLFKDEVSKKEIDEQIKELEKAGGKVNKRWDGGILNGFSASIPTKFLETFKSLQADKITSIEPDGVVTIQ